MTRWSSLRARFFSGYRRGIDPNGCWEWTGSRNSVGYGVIHGEGRKHYAHRLSWRLIRGPIPSGMCVLHSCDNRGCVNPRHLFIGTKADNTHDMWSKGRQAGAPARNATKQICDCHGLELVNRRCPLRYRTPKSAAAWLRQHA